MIDSHFKGQTMARMLWGTMKGTAKSQGVQKRMDKVFVEVATEIAKASGDAENFALLSSRREERKREEVPHKGA